MKRLLEIWGLLDQRQRRVLVSLLVLSLVMAFSTLGGIAAILPFFTVLAEPAAVRRSAFLTALATHFRDQRSFEIALGSAFAGVVLAANAINLLGSVAMARFAYSVGNTFHASLFSQYLHADYAFHLSASSATLANKVLYEAARVSAGILQNALILSANLATIVLIAVSIVLVNPLVASVALAGLGLSYGAIYLLVRRKVLRNGVLESKLFAQRIAVVNESFGAIKEIIALETPRLFVDRFARACEAIGRTAVSTLAISQTPKHILECLTVAGLAGAALFLSGRGAAGSPWLPQLTFIGFAAYRLLPALQQVFVAVVKIRADSPALENIAADLKRARAAKEIRNSEPARQAAAAAARTWRGRPLREIRLEDVSFRYDTDRPVAVRAVTLRIPAGAMAGFIGPNGSGKTTTADLILGLLTPQSGCLAVDGIVVDETNRRHWQSTLAYVPQHIFLMDATVAENIALGIPAGEIDPVQLRDAARMAKIDEFAAHLPKGYEEVIGERGVRLSGGQRQRIGIARALYRNASLVVLDEATSALDDSIEKELMTALEALRGRCTVILIAHRLSTVRSCDVLFGFEGGRVVGSGSYQQLMRESTRLREIIGFQSEDALRY